MTTLSIMLSLWATVVVAFIALMIYRANLTNHEADQLFLNEDVPSSTHQEQDAIVRRVNTLGPICKGVGGLAVLMTFAVAGIWFAQTLASANL
jgi:preprotein translocase subunit SecG